MQQLTVDGAVLAVLKGIRGRTEIRGQWGQVVGYFSPVEWSQQPFEIEEGVEYYPAPITRAEVERRKRDRSGKAHTTKEVFERLLSLTTDEELRKALQKNIAGREGRDRRVSP